MGYNVGQKLGKYGPPGVSSSDFRYRRHYEYCKEIGKRISYAAFVKACGEPKRQVANQYGPPGSKAADPLARAHRQYCTYFRQKFTWDEYLARKDARKAGNQWGRPGERVQYEAKNHQKFCTRLGRYVPWDEYRHMVEATSRKPDDLSEQAIADRVAANIEKFRRMGLVA